MAYRANVQFKEGSTSSPPSDVVAAPAPRCGDTIEVDRHGLLVAALVTALWTPTAKVRGPRSDGLVMVEAREI